MSQDLKSLSKKNYTVDDGSPSYDTLNTSALLRIADATEVMTKRYSEIIADMEWYKRKYFENMNTITTRNNTIKALKGVITKLKKQHKESERTSE
jgi:hypothetical protein